MESSVDFKQLVETVADTVIASDVGGTITLWNPAAERMFGFSESEALGQSLDLIIPRRHRRSHWEGFHQTMATGVNGYGSDVVRAPAVRKDGHTLSIAFTMSLLYSADNQASAIVAVIRDETCRYNEERNQRKRLAELELQSAESAEFA
jgi:PAS domain S-box-containing protein